MQVLGPNFLLVEMEVIGKMPFLWNQGILHKHAWECGDCGFTMEFNTREWAFREIREHKKNCKKKQN